MTEAALRGAKAVVVLWSPRSVVSRWVRAEATVADRNKTLVPVMIEPCDRPIMFELTQTAELSHWRGSVDDRAWKAFVADVRQMVSQNAPLSILEIEPTGAPALQPTPDSGKAAQRGSVPSLAILPFTNRSKIKDDEVFAEGMVEDIVAALSQSELLRVLGSISTAHLKKGTFDDLAAIGKQLGVRYLLEGNVRRSGQDFRVTTQLIDAATGELVWSGQFARPLDELQDLQEELINEVAIALDVKIQALDMERALRKPGNITAWEAVQRSTVALRRFDDGGVLTAIEEAKRAVELAPDFAAAHALLACMSANLYHYASPDDPLKVAQIRGHAAKALEIDPGSTQVMSAVANAYSVIGFPEEGLPWAMKAYSLAPNNGISSFQLGLCKALLDQNEEAMKYLETAYLMMPGSYMRIWPRAWQSSVMVQERRFDKAEIYLDECLAIDPDYFPCHLGKALLCWSDGRREQAAGFLTKLDEKGVGRAVHQRMISRSFFNSTVVVELLDGVHEMWDAFEAQASA